MQALKEPKKKKPTVSVSVLRAIRPKVNNTTRKSSGTVSNRIVIDEVIGKATLNVSMFIYCILYFLKIKFQKLSKVKIWAILRYIFFCDVFL